MEENGSKKKIPPKWWANVISDIERATQAAKVSFNDTNIVLGTETDDTNNILGYLIRVSDKSIGYYSVDKIKRKLPVGSKIKNKLPEPEEKREEPKLEVYIFEVIRENITLIPKMWLRKVIDKIVNGKPITIKEDLVPFPKWVLLPLDKREDKALIDILYRATRYEGIRGLARFNDVLEPWAKLY